jgi:ribosome-binding protein aMBF1 (putative translation factor)
MNCELCGAEMWKTDAYNKVSDQVWVCGNCNNIKVVLI